MVEVPDSTTRYIQSDSGKPTKDLFNWMRNISQMLSGTGGGLFSSGLPCFSVHKNGTNQTGIPNATVTTLTWSTEAYDVGNYFSSNIWTPPAGKVHLCAGFVADPDAGICDGVVIFIYKNAAPVKQAIGSTVFTIASGVIAIDDIANGTDSYYVAVYCSNTSATTNTVRGAAAQTWFMGHWISP